MKILLLPMGGIGNMLMFTPTIEKLHKQFPKAKIMVIMQKDSAYEVLKSFDYLDVVISPLSIQKAISLRKENFDLCLIPYPSSGVRKIIFSLIAGVKRIISHPYHIFWKKSSLFIDPVQEKKQHDITSNLDLIRKLGIKILPTDSQMKFYLNKKDKEYANKFFRDKKIKKAIGIHLGSREGMSYKRWPIKKFNQLINYLVKKGNNVLVFFGSEEEPLIKKVSNSPEVFFIRNVSLSKCAALIQKCNFFISNDSGLMHLAVSQKVPTLGIFGPTIYWRTFPYGKQNKIVKKDLPCTPCYNPYKKFVCKNIKCLNLLTFEQVKNAFEKLCAETQ